MAAFVRSATKNLSRRLDGYDNLDQSYRQISSKSEENHNRRSYSIRRREEARDTIKSCSYKMERAKQRRVFLKSYELSLVGKRERVAKSAQIKNKVAVQAKKAVVEVISFLRIGNLRTCKNGSSICIATSDRRAVKCFRFSGQEQFVGSSFQATRSE